MVSIRVRGSHSYRTVTVAAPLAVSTAAVVGPVRETGAKGEQSTRSAPGRAWAAKVPKTWLIAVSSCT